MNQREQLLANIKKKVYKQDVVLTSGRVSDYYINVKSACAEDPFLACSVVASHVGAYYLTVCDLIAGPATGSAPIVFGLATLHQKPALMAGVSLDMRNLGRLYSDHKEILLLDDVVTTGGSINKVENFITDKYRDINIKKLCIVNRGDTDIESIYSLEEVLND